MEKQKQSQRLQSLDALRGFDMFFIMGGGALFVALATWIPTPFFQSIADQMPCQMGGGVYVRGYYLSVVFVYCRYFFSFFAGETAGAGNVGSGYL